VLVHSSARVLNFRSASLAQPADTEYSFETETETDNAALVDQFEFSDETASDDALGDTDSDSDVAALGEKTSLEDDSLEPLQASKPALDAAPSAAPLGAVTTDDDDDLALAGYSADEMLDKGALRDMIAEVIREELQGVLGERITSNVRRLVRREVQRALTLREFD
jgi:cell pole-organizing protein PopZ